MSGTKNLQLARSLGARQVIDYTAEYFTGNGRTYDVNYDDTGTPRHDRGLLATCACRNLVHGMRPVDIR